MAGALRGTLLTTTGLAKDSIGATRGGRGIRWPARWLIGPLASYKTQDNQSLQRSTVTLQNRQLSLLRPQRLPKHSRWEVSPRFSSPVRRDTFRV